MLKVPRSNLLALSMKAAGRQNFPTSSPMPWCLEVGKKDGRRNGEEKEKEYEKEYNRKDTPSKQY